MKKWIILLIGIICLSAAIADTLTYGPENYLKNRRNILSGSTTSDPLYLFINEVDDTFGGTESVNFLLFNPTTEPGTPAAGQFYFDTASNTMKFANNSATFVALASASGNSLDQSYDAGIAITVDAGAVALTATDAANNVALAIAQSDTGTSKAITITNAGSGNSLDFQGTSGFDIQGTDDSWTASIAGIFDGEGLTGVTNSQGILFDTNNEIQFGAASEDVAMDFATSNTLKWRSDTAVDTMDFGTVDTLIDLEDITFDAASASIITQAGSGDADDLTIRQTGTVDVSLILSSAGSITDALSILTTDAVGVIKISSSDILDIDAVDNINMDISGAGANLDIDSALGSVYIDGGEAAANAIVIDASNAAGGIDLDYGTGNFVITGTGASADLTIDADLISIDGTGASNITFTNGADEDVTIATAGAADHSLIISATGTAADAMQITTSAGGIDITNGGASGEDLDIDGVLSALNINSDEATGDAITITTGNAAGGIDITSGTGNVAILSTDEITLTVATAATDNIIITNTAGTSVTEDSGAINLIATAGAVIIDSSANLDNAIQIRADGGAAAEMEIHNDAGTTEDSIHIVSDEGGIDIDFATGKNMAITGGQFIVTSNEDVASAINLVTNTGTSETIVVTNTLGNGAGAITIDAAAGGVTIDTLAGAAGDITLTAGDDLVLAVSGNVTGNIAGDGSDTFGGYLRPVLVQTDADETVTIAQSGTIFYSLSAQGIWTLTLPDAQAGLYYTVVDVSATGADDVHIDPQGGDTIDGDAAGDGLSNTADEAAAVINIFSVDGVQWFTTGATGTWVAD